jgi:hypothetical protein
MGLLKDRHDHNAKKLTKKYRPYGEHLQVVYIELQRDLSPCWSRRSDIQPFLRLGITINRLSFLSRIRATAHQVPECKQFHLFLAQRGELQSRLFGWHPADQSMCIISQESDANNYISKPFLAGDIGSQMLDVYRQ